MSKQTALSLPPPRADLRSRRVLIALTDGEHERLTDLAQDRGEPVATVARTLIVTAMDTLERS